MSKNGKLIVAMIIVIAIVLIAVSAYYFTEIRGTILVSGVADGASVSLQCQPGQTVQVVWAVYVWGPKGVKTDVTDKLQAIISVNSLIGTKFTVSGSALNQVPGGVLSFRYRCAQAKSAEGFHPVPVSTCGSPYDDHYAVDMTSRNAAGTVVWDPYSTQSRVSLERSAESPEVAESFNPYTGLGKTSSVRALNDRYRRNEALQAINIFEYQPGEPGYMEQVSDGAMSLISKVARRPPTAAGGCPSCLLAGTDVDSDYLTDGYYDEAVLKEALTSRRQTAPNTLTASRVGLGSVRMDPRFEPGPPTRTPDGDASWANGSSAGGPTTGGFGAYKFMPGNTWDSHYVHGFGDYNIQGRQYPVEAMVTGESRW